MQKSSLVSIVVRILGDKSGSFAVVCSHVRNWYELPFFAFGIRNHIDIEAKSGGTFRVVKKPSFIEMGYKGGKIRFRYSKSGDVIHILLMLIGEFIAEPHKGLKVKGKDVVDIGAYVADTAIYFALSGASHVYAIEPSPHSCRIAKRNIRMNNLSHKITLINAGCASKAGTMNIDPKFESLASAQITKRKAGKKVKVVTLEAIVKKYGLQKAAMKIDCEGCEYDLIKGTSTNVLKRFSNILIEYHYGYKPLTKKLSEIGFRTSHTIPEESINSNTKEEMQMGDIYAVQK